MDFLNLIGHKTSQSNPQEQVNPDLRPLDFGFIVHQGILHAQSSSIRASRCSLYNMPLLGSIPSSGVMTSSLRHLLPRQSSPSSLIRTFSQIPRLSANNILRTVRAQPGNAVATGSRPSVGASPSVRLIDQIRGMKTRSSVKRLCDGCKVCRYLILRGNKSATVCLALGTLMLTG